MGETCGTHENKDAHTVFVDIPEESECVEVLQVGGRITLKHTSDTMGESCGVDYSGSG